MSEPPETYLEWLKQMKDLKGGWLGWVVILVTLIVTPVFVYHGLDLFEPGRYPRIVLALPGLIVSVIFFFSLSGLLWPLKKQRAGKSE